MATAQSPQEEALSGLRNALVDRLLMPFQRVGVATVLRNNGKMLVADEMGLGKTIQVNMRLMGTSACTGGWDSSCGVAVSY